MTRIDQRFDTSGALLEEIEHNGDGTGTRRTYSAGVLTATEAVAGLPVDQPSASIAEVFEAVPVTSLEEANEVLAGLKAALEQKGIL